MAERGNGGIIGPANVPNAATASGLWTLEEQQDAKGLNSWPGFAIQRSLRFNSADSAYLNRTPASASNRRTWTFSAWVKAPVGLSLFSAGASGAQRSQFGIEPSLNNVLYYYENSGSGNAVNVYTNALFRDPSAWYHFVLAFDTTQATDSNRVKIYVNGVQQTIAGSPLWPTQNYDSCVNNTVPQLIGQYAAGGNFNGYVTEVNFIDGQALTPSSFGITNPDTGVWQPKAYAGTYGTNGFYLNFSDNSNTTATTLGKDYSGNGNNWTPNNFSVTAGAGNDSLVDVPTNWGTDTGVGGTVRGNYCTLNPLDNGGLTLSNGNLTSARAAFSWIGARSTLGLSSGKWYWEGSNLVVDGSNHTIVGISTSSQSLADYLGSSANSWGYRYDGSKITNGSTTGYGASYTGSDVIGIAFDADAGTLTFYKNGVSQGTAFSGLTSGPYFPAISQYGTVTANFNFGQRPFAYTAPSGFKALCTQNLPTPTIGATASTQAGKYFNTVLYTGNSTNPRAISGFGFSPDYIVQARRDVGYGLQYFDIVRGAGKRLNSSSTAAEDTYNIVGSFDSDGFTITGNVDQGNNVSGGSYVAWGWDAGGAGVTNTSGSITSTVSANTTSGFSVVTWTASATDSIVGHGLGATPAMIIAKSRTSAVGWPVYHKSLGASQVLVLNTTAAVATDAGYWGTPNSATFGVRVVNASWNNVGNMVAYCFAEVPGFSKFGSYTGNGSTDGPFVYCGFRPAFVMIKASSAADFGSWRVHDTKRSPSNVVDKLLIPNLADAEGTFVQLDILSNGFKIRENYSGLNANGQTLIFAAFAEAPQKFALAR